jgi:hypothetical protein
MELLIAVIPLLLDVIENYPATRCKGTAASVISKMRMERRYCARDLDQLHCELRTFLFRIVTDGESLTMDQWDSVTTGNCEPKLFFDTWKAVVDQNGDIIQELTENETIEEVVGNTLGMLQEMLYLDPPPRSMVETLIDVLKIGREYARVYLEEHLSRIFKFISPNKMRQGLIYQLKEDVILVKSLNKAPNKIPEHRTRTPQRSKDEFPAVIDIGRRYSSILHNTLSTLWSCTCHRIQSAMLRLGPKKLNLNDAFESPFFTVVFRFERDPSELQARSPSCQETDIYILKTYGPPIS